MANRLVVAALAVAGLSLVAMPGAAQQMLSQGYTFLKAVKERDSTTVHSMIRVPGTTVINTRNRETGRTALHYMVEERDTPWVSLLLNRGARVDIGDNEGNAPLSITARMGWVEGAEMLLRNRADVNARNRRGETALIMAVQNRDIPMVRLLLANGADINITDSVTGYSALDYARRDNRAGTILRLLEMPRTQPGAN